jgi:hypothetical protein
LEIQAQYDRINAAFREPEPTRYNDYVTELVALQERQDTCRNFQMDCRYAIEREYAARGDNMNDPRLSELAKEVEKQARVLEDQREALRKQMLRRIFKPARGDDVVSQMPIPWHIPEGHSDCICYPIRISGIHGNALLGNIFAMLQQKLDVLPTDIVLYSHYHEVDSSATLELGLRYCEDAFYIFFVLHGVETDSRYLEVQFLRAMTGQVHAIFYPPSPPPEIQRTLVTRLKRIVPLARHPGSLPEFNNAAYGLEGEIQRALLSKKLATVAEIQGIKDFGWRPIRKSQSFFITTYVN